MSDGIEAILLDVGNTLRTLVSDDAFATQAELRLVALAGGRDRPSAFFKKVKKRWKAYRKWSHQNLVESSDEELWTRWLRPDRPPELIAPIAGPLTRLWRETDGQQVARAHASPTLIELSGWGYVLGIVVHAISETDIPDWLKAEGLTDHFKAVVVSSSVRHRKPAPEIYREAVSRI